MTYSLLGKQGNRRTADRSNCWHFSGRFLRQSVKLLALEYSGDSCNKLGAHLFSLYLLQNLKPDQSTFHTWWWCCTKSVKCVTKWQNFNLLSLLAHHFRLSSEFTVFFEKLNAVSEKATNPQSNEREIINVARLSFLITPKELSWSLCLLKLFSRAVLEQARQTLGRRVGVALVRLRLKSWTPNLFSVLGCQTKPFQDAFSRSSWMTVLGHKCQEEKRVKQTEMEGENGRKEWSEGFSLEKRSLWQRQIRVNMWKWSGEQEEKRGKCKWNIWIFIANKRKTSLFSRSHSCCKIWINCTVYCMES